MKDNHEFKLVKGQFSVQETKQILFTLINDKIKFHQLDLFSKSERNTGNKVFSQLRIKELNECKQELDSFLELAKEKNLEIKINGDITLNLV